VDCGTHSCLNCRRGLSIKAARYRACAPWTARLSFILRKTRGHRPRLQSLILVLLLSFGCRRAFPEQSNWTGTVELANGTIHLPFQMFLDLRATRPTGYFLIGDEKAPIPEITRQGDSLTFTFSEYGAEMRSTWNGSRLNGTYIRHRPEGLTTLKFSASPAASESSAHHDVSANNVSAAGKYQVYFSDENREKSATVASVWTKGDLVYGTFIAPDGDYGLLVGNASGGKIQLNRFTGWQAIAITLERSGENWSGNFYFQNDKPRAFTLERRTTLDIAAPANFQTSMKDPAAAFTFDGVSISGETVRGTDDRFKGKPLIIDIMGTWCHNCQDEAPLLQDLQAQYGRAGLQVVGISFEVADDAELGKKNLKLYQDRLGLTYTLLYCGSIDDSNVNRRLKNQLNNFFAYPTTLFIGRDGKVKTIHSGFKGPGTGAEYQSQIEELHQLAESLLN
jgi:thiol-disulfide isomerase/thioredoxin